MQKINVLFNLIIAPPLLFFFYAFLEKQNATGKQLEDASDLNIKVAAIVLVVGAIVASKVVYGRLVALARQPMDLDQKLQKLLQAFIVRFAILETPMIGLVLLYYYFDGVVYLVMYILILAFYTLNKPSRNKIVMVLGLSGEDRDKVLKR